MNYRVSQLCDRTAYGIYHCVSSDFCSWFEFAQKILFQAKKDVKKVRPTAYINYDFKAVRPQNTIMSTHKLSKFYNMPTYLQALEGYLASKTN